MTTGSTARYWQDLIEAVTSLCRGLVITLRHLLRARRTQKVLSITDNNYFVRREGIATIQYPYEMQPIPEVGRYRLHNEIDDCIVCDKCAKVCPVDCIDIEPIRATEEIGKTSDGTPKRIYAAKFDIDMGKCCFCGLCTTVCPTECLTMTRVYDFSVTDIREHNYEFAEMTPAEIEEKKQLFDAFQKNKLQESPPTAQEPGSTPPSSPKPARPVFKPKMKPPGPPKP
jgi:NADH-quinone oxidoreductase subunit I